MAIFFITSFDTIYLSAHLPEKVFISAAGSSIEVTLYINDDLVFSSTYFPYHGKVCISDIRSIIEAEMIDQQLDMAILKMVAKNSDGESAVVDQVIVVYSTYKSSAGSEGFLNRNFLSTRKSALIPRDGQVTLSHFRKAYEEGYNNAVIYYTLPQSPGHVFEYSSELGRINATSTGIVEATLTHAYFKEIVDNGRNLDCTVLGVEYSLGLRHFNIYFTDEKPTDVFTFLNVFNKLEKIYLYGATTTKTEVNRSEAIYGRRTQFYDETVNVKHEVETAPMPYDEAMWFSQLFASKWVYKDMGEDSTLQILIKDSSSEVTDNSKELITLKFSWICSDGVEWTE